MCRFHGGFLTGLAGPLLRHGLFERFSSDLQRHYVIDDIGFCFKYVFRRLAAASL